MAHRKAPSGGRKRISEQKKIDQEHKDMKRLGLSAEELEALGLSSKEIAELNVDKGPAAADPTKIDLGDGITVISGLPVFNSKLRQDIANLFDENLINSIEEFGRGEFDDTLAAAAAALGNPAQEDPGHTGNLFGGIDFNPSPDDPNTPNFGGPDSGTSNPTELVPIPTTGLPLPAPRPSGRPPNQDFERDFNFQNFSGGLGASPAAAGIALAASAIQAAGTLKSLIGGGGPDEQVQTRSGAAFQPQFEDDQDAGLAMFLQLLEALGVGGDPLPLQKEGLTELGASPIHAGLPQLSASPISGGFNFAEAEGEVSQQFQKPSPGRFKMVNSRVRQAVQPSIPPPAGLLNQPSIPRTVDQSGGPSNQPLGQFDIQAFSSQPNFVEEEDGGGGAGPVQQPPPQVPQPQFQGDPAPPTQPPTAPPPVVAPPVAPPVIQPVVPPPVVAPPPAPEAPIEAPPVAAPPVPPTNTTPPDGSPPTSGIPPNNAFADIAQQFSLPSFGNNTSVGPTPLQQQSTDFASDFLANNPFQDTEQIQGALSNILGGETFDNSAQFAALEARSQRQFDEQSAQMKELFGTQGARFGSDIARGQADLGARRLENDALLRANIGQSSFNDARNLQLQGLPLPGQLGQQSLNQATSVFNIGQANAGQQERNINREMAEFARTQGALFPGLLGFGLAGTEGDTTVINPNQLPGA